MLLLLLLIICYSPIATSECTIKVYVEHDDMGIKCIVSKGCKKANPNYYTDTGEIELISGTTGRISRGGVINPELSEKIHSISYTPFKTSHVRFYNPIPFSDYACVYNGIYSYYYHFSSAKPYQGPTHDEIYLPKTGLSWRESLVYSAIGAIPLSFAVYVGNLLYQKYKIRQRIDNV